MAVRSRSDGAAGLLVLDEFPYLARETPGLPSIVQSLYDSLGPGSGAQAPSLRLILCGSAISVMGDLLSGTKALRGRAALELRVRAFGYRDARAYWGIESPAAAFAHNAVVGGTPGYRELVLDPRVPENPARLGDWLARNVLRPSMPLFDEASRVVHEDPRIRDAGAYRSVLAAVAAGESSPTKIGGLLGRPATSLAHQMTMLASAGFIDRRQDLLLDRRPVVTVADPMVRFDQLVIQPYLADLEAAGGPGLGRGGAHRRVEDPGAALRGARGRLDRPLCRCRGRAWRSARSGRRSSPAVSTRRATRLTCWGWHAAAARQRPRRAGRIYRRGQAPRPATGPGGVAQAGASARAAHGGRPRCRRRRARSLQHVGLHRSTGGRSREQTGNDPPGQPQRALRPAFVSRARRRTAPRNAIGIGPAGVAL